MTKNYVCLFGFLALMLVFSCSEDNSYVPQEEEQISPVVFDLENIPYNTLSEYNFFEGDIKELSPVYGVIPYDLNSSLFSDYAKKKRFIWMPDEVSANYVDDYLALDFPTGTVLIKNFYYNNVLPENETVIIETRLMIKLEDRWSFANYLWNENQTEAFFTDQAATKSIEWIENGQTKQVNYQVPRFAECFTCHNKFENPLPIGLKPQNINKTYAYADGSMNQLEKLIDQGYLNPDITSDIDTMVSWKNENEDINLRVRSYLDINCAHCHSEQGYCNYAPMRFDFKDTEESTALGVCIENDFYLGDDIEHIFSPNNITTSAAYFRMATAEEQFKMPLIGRTLVHEEGIDLIETWINTLTENCN